jgi:DHA2 family multidrug resistance protein
MSTHSTQDIGSEWLPSVNPWIITVAVMLPTFLEVLDTTIVAVALPNIAGSMASTNNEATWVLTSYLVANAVVLPASGWFALRFGRKRFLMFCTALFTLATFLCGLAWSMPLLILARILQGAAGGALMPLSQAILLESFPREKQGMAMAMFGLGVVGAPIIGPILGGWLTDTYSWRWAFNFKIPFAILAIYLIAKYIEDPPYIRHAKAGRIDVPGFALLTLWLATLQIVLDKGQQQDWFASSWILWFSIVSVVALAALLVRELRTPEPLVDLRVFRNRNFWAGTGTSIFIMGAMYSVLAMLPLFLQTLLGYKSQTAGLAIAPLGIGAMIAMPIVGALMSWVDGRWLMSFGIALITSAMFLFGDLTLDISMASIIWPDIIQGLGIGFVMVPLMAMSVGTLPNEKIGNASGIFNLARNLGGSIGISVSTTFLVRTTQTHQANLVTHMTPYDPMFQERLSELAAGLSRYCAEPVAHMQAYGLLHGMLLQQSNLMAYVDIFRWIALIIALCLPGLWMLRKAVTKGTATLH